jgi:sigma-B regulation protein RsbU (phosphoserine phosphatase)
MKKLAADNIPIPLGYGRPIRVLLVEDDPDQANLAMAYLNGDRSDLFRVEWKDNLLNAVSRLAQPGIDVVLLDLGMPDLSGYKTHLAITPVTQKTPVVVLTADESAVSKDVTKMQGVFRYLLKQRTSPVVLRQVVHEAALSAPL